MAQKQPRIPLRRKKLFSLITLLIISYCTPLVAEVNASWAHEGSDLKPDSSLTFGSLYNGMRYVIMPNKEPKENVSLRLYINVGSIMEEENQRGLAHYLEHLAFQGTKNFPAGEMVKYFQRIGVAFGADTNAHTSFYETVYKIDLPKNTIPYLDDGFKVLRDFADKMLLEEDQIERERGVILAEKRQRDSVAYRQYKAQLRFLLPETRFTERFVIGTKETIESVMPPDFVSFYNKWYTADRMVLVVVGEVNPKEVESFIKKHFASLKKPKTKLNTPEVGNFTHEGLAIQLHKEEEADETTVAIHNVQPFPYEIDNLERRTEEVALDLANKILNRRLEVLRNKKDAPFTNGAAYSYNFFDEFLIAELDITSNHDQWQEALAIGEQELRRALTDGFTETEFKEAQAIILNDYKTEADQATTRLSKNLARHIVYSIGQNTVFMSPSDEYELAKDILASLNKEKAFEAFSKSWGSNNRRIFITGNINLEEPDKQILATYESSQATEVEAPKEEEAIQFRYTDFGSPGKIADNMYFKDLDVYQLRLDNNVRLNLKPTEFESNQISILIRFGAGLLSLEKEFRGLESVSTIALILGGLKEHSYADLKRIFASKNISAHFNIAPNAFIFSATTNKEDLRMQLNLLLAYIMEPGYRLEGLSIAHKELDSIYQYLTHTPGGVLENEGANFLASGDFRFGLPKQEQILTYTEEDIQNWLTPALKEGYMEISIVGDFDVQETIRQVAATFGTLPKRDFQKKPYTAERIVKFQQDIHKKIFPVDTEIPKAYSMLCWPTADGWDISENRRIGLLASILDDRIRLELRDNLGETYSSFVANNASETYTNFGYLSAISVVDPENIDLIAKATVTTAEKLAEEGVTQDELDRALNPILNSIKKSLRDNGYWLNIVLENSQEHPQKLSWARSRTQDYQSITVEDINKVAKKFLKKDTRVQLDILPKNPIKE